MGKRLAEHGHQPDLIISSPAKRAFSTAKKIAKELDFDKSEIMTDESLYFSGSGSMVSMLENLDDRFQSVMIVGHNPAMTGLLNVLSEAQVDNMPTSAIAVVSFDMATWSELGDTGGDLLAYDFPKNSGGFSA